MPRVAVVGAGVAGLTVAYELRGRAADVTLYEKSRGYGGRAATRGRYGCRYDHGAPYVQPTSARVDRLLRGHLPTEQLVRVPGPVWLFDAEGTLRRPAVDDARPRWTYTHGISTLGKLLAHYGRAEVHRETRIEAVRRREGGWRLRTAAGAESRTYDAVVLTPPAPQSAALLGPGSSGDAVRSVRTALEAVDYAPQFAYVLAYDRPLARQRRVYGLQSDAEQHPIDWIGLENRKPGHVPDGQTLLVVHTSPAWTAPRVDNDPAAHVDPVIAEAEALLSEDLRGPAWTDTQRWRYARPVSAVDPAALEAGAEAGLFVAGDGAAGRGSVSAAIESGLETAARLREGLGA